MVDADAAQIGVIVQLSEIKWPSVVTDLSSEVYHAVDALSSTRLQILNTKTNLHLSHKLSNPDDNEDFVVGRALHAAVLQPEVYAAEFIAMPDGLKRTTKEGKAEYERLIATGKQVMSASQAKQVEGMRQSILMHSDAAMFLRSMPGQAEVSAFVEVDGINHKRLQAKARFDRVVDIGGEVAIVDLKTTRSASREEFERSIWGYGYGTQCALYLRAARQFWNVQHFVFCVVEKEAPFVSAVYRMSDTVIKEFNYKLDLLIDRYKNYIENPTEGYTGITEIGVPAWALRKLELETIGEITNV